MDDEYEAAQKTVLSLEDLQSIFKTFQVDLQERLELILPNTENTSGEQGQNEAQENQQIQSIIEDCLFHAMYNIYESFDVQGIDAEYIGKQIAFIANEQRKALSAGTGDLPEAHADDDVETGEEAYSNSVDLLDENTVDIRCVLLKDDEKEIEAFDEKLSDEVRSKYQDWEDQMMRIAYLRKHGYVEVTDEYTQQCDNFLTTIDQQIESCLSTLNGEEGTEGILGDINTGDDKDDAQLQSMLNEYQPQYVNALKELNDSVYNKIPLIKRKAMVIDKKRDFLKRELGL
mgnify:CR=1 FL=1